MTDMPAPTPDEVVPAPTTRFKLVAPKPVEPEVVPAEPTEEEKAVFAGAVRILVDNPLPKLTAEDVENQRVAAEKAAQDAVNLAAAQAAVDAAKAA